MGVVFLLGEVKLDIETYNELIKSKIMLARIEGELCKAEQLVSNLTAHIVAENISQWAMKTDARTFEEKLDPFSGCFIVTNIQDLLALGIELDEIVYYASQALEIYEASEGAHD